MKKNAQAIKSDFEIREQYRLEIRKEVGDLLKANDFFMIKKRCAELFSQWPLHYWFVACLFENCSIDQVDAVDLVTKDVPTACPQVFEKWLLAYKKRMFERHGCYDKAFLIDSEIDVMQLERPNPWLHLLT